MWQTGSISSWFSVDCGESSRAAVDVSELGRALDNQIATPTPTKNEYGRNIFGRVRIVSVALALGDGMPQACNVSDMAGC